MLNNVFGAPSSTLAGAAAAAGTYQLLSTLIPAPVGAWIGGISAAIIVIAGALAPTITSILGRKAS